MLTKSQKEAIVDEIADKVKKSKALVFSDFKGLKVKDMTQIRKDLRLEGVEFKVLKKTLAYIALKKAGKEVDIKKMEGQVALAMSKEDEVIAAKLIAKAAKSNENIKILGGMIDLRYIEKEEVLALSKLPSKEELLATFVGTINAPISGFVNVLAGNIRNLLNVLKAINEAK
jgi:large subunit ribosomal protein L10